jgi:hypothetical protein
MKKIYFVLLVLCLASCKEKKKSNGKENDVIPSISVQVKDTQKFNIDSVADFHSVIPLETSDNSLIGNIKKVFLTDSLIVIFDDKINNILTFDYQGNYQYAIGSKGNGPNEYIRITDVFLDPSNNLLYLADGVRKQILQFDIAGNFISSQASEYPLLSFYPFEEGYWGVIHYEDKKRHNLLLMDRELKTKQGYFSSTTRLPLIASNPFSVKENGEAFFHEPYNNVLYRIVGENIEPYLEFIFTGRKNREEVDGKNPFQSTALLLNVHSYKNHLFFQFSEPQEKDALTIRNCYIDLNNLEPVVFAAYDNLCKDIPLPSFSSILALSDSKLVFQIVPGIFPEEMFERFKATSLNDITHESNPVLVLYNLK